MITEDPDQHQEPTIFDRPPIAQEAVSILLLAPGEGKALEEQVRPWVNWLDQLGKTYEIFLVLDAPESAVSNAKEDLQSKFPQVRLLHSLRPGPGACLRAGLPAARHPLVFYTILDGSYQPADLAQLLKWIDKADIVCGTRVTSEGRYRKTWGEWGVRFLARWIFGIRLSDPDCWFLLARRSIFARIPIQSDGPFAQVEVLAKANFLSCIMSDTPITYRPGQVASPRTGILREAHQVFHHPDFGPPVLSS